MGFMYELIHKISKLDMLTMEHRLSSVMQPDLQVPSGIYQVYCLYFDRDMEGTMMDSSTGVYKQDEYQFCYYNNKPDTIILNKKTMMNGMSSTESCEVTREFVDAIINNRFSEIVTDPMGRTGENVDPLIQEFYWEVVGNGLRPTVLMDYDSKVYYLHGSDAQITINYNPRSSLNLKDFFNPFHATVPVRDDRAFVHIKWNGYLPEMIRKAVTMTGKASNLFSYMM